MLRDEKRYIPRPDYDHRLDASLTTSHVKILSGVRRCGKSTLLAMLVQRMLAAGFPESNIFYRRFDSFGMPVNPDADWLLSELRTAMDGADPVEPFRVFLDEVQEVNDWEKVVRQLHTRAFTDVFITGSNAYVLSSDLSTFLAGRYEVITVYPLSFREYVSFAHEFDGYPDDVNELFNAFLTYGGMPGLFEFPYDDREAVHEELNTLFSAVLLNDVARRSRISDIDLLTKLIRYVYSTSGSLFSTKKISDSLTSMGRKVKSETVDNYLKALERAYAMFACEQEGLAGKSMLRPLRKFYPVDTGFRNLPSGFSGQDLGYQLENVVFIELKRRGYEVYVGALPATEIDFIAQQGAERLYLQVSTSLAADEVYEREIAPLNQLNDSFPKIVLTLEGWRTGITDTGIKIMRLTDWLLDRQGLH